MGFAGWEAGHTVVAAEITIRFLAMLPLGQVVQFEAWVDQVDGKKVKTAGRVFTRDGAIYSEATGLFIVIDPETFCRILDNKPC
jgi:predicted thioesterase